jgi:hypothetical protein
LIAVWEEIKKKKKKTLFLLDFLLLLWFSFFFFNLFELQCKTCFLPLRWLPFWIQIKVAPLPFCKSFVGREGKRNKLMQTLDWTWQQHTTSLFFFFYLLFWAFPMTPEKI